MKSKVYYSVVVVAIAITTIISINHELTSALKTLPVAKHLDKPYHKMSLRDRMDLAMQQEFDRTKDPETGRVPRERLFHAYEEIRRQNLRHGKAAISGIEWIERGPNNVGGRTRAMLFDLNDNTNNTVFAGSVAGGLWKTTNIFSSEAKWEPVNDFFGNMAVSAIAQDPSSPNIMYFGTGEGYYNVDAVRGDGIWKSTDSGNTWSQLSLTRNDSFSYVNKIIVDGDGNVIVGTKGTYVNNGGIYRSTDGGTTFTEVLERYTGSGGSEYDRCADIEIAADGKTYYASMGIFSTDGIYKSTDSAKTWSRVYNANSTGEQRIDLVCAPSNANYIYALVQGTGNGIGKIMKSTDAGSNWSTCTTISYNDQCGGSSSNDFTRSQAWYNLAAAVDPNDEDVLVVGGINLFRTDDGGTSWNQLSSWVGCGGYSKVHSDHHVLMFYPNSSDTVINANDGGIYVTEEVTTSYPTWTMKNDGYNVTQFYAGAMHPDAMSDYFLCGAQDNGSQRFQSTGINSTDEVTGGDGAFCHIDQEHPDTQMTAYTYNSIYVSSDGFSSSSYQSTGTGNFINASDYDSDNKILYAASGARKIHRWTNIGGSVSGTDVTISNIGTGNKATAILVSPSTPTTVYVGTDNGRVVQITGANSGNSNTNLTTGTLPSGTVSSIAEDPFDPSHLMVTYSNYGIGHVFETTNGGTTWTEIDGNLPDMPVRWAMFSPWGGDSALIATELGVWSTSNINGSSTNWEVSNDGLSNCRVDMLEYRESDSVVMAITHGRGVYTTNFFSQREVAQFGMDEDLVYIGNPINFYDGSYGATSWSWDFDNDGNAESTLQNPTYAYGEGGVYTVSLTINGTTTTTRTVQVLPNLPIPYTTSDGGDMESNAWHFGGKITSGGYQLWERGAPSNYFSTSHYNGSNAWVTDLDADIPQADVECSLLTPSFNFSASGTYTLSFKKSMETYYSNAPAAALVHYSTDNGYTWTQLGSSSSGGTGWYGSGVSSYIYPDGDGWLNNYNKSTSSHDVSFLAGNDRVCFRIGYKITDVYSASPTYDIAGFLVDDFQISGPSNDAITAAGIETELYSKTLDLGANDSAHYYSANGKLIASIWNLSSHNFGATTVEIDEVGSTAQDFDTNTQATNQIFSKTIKITPTSNSSSASMKIAMYYTAEELSGWKSATSRFAKDAQLFKTTNAIDNSTIAQGVYPSATTLDSSFNESDFMLVGTFSNGFSGVGAGGGGVSPGGPLPVELLSFTGTRNSDRVELNWSTASEINNDYFEVLRSVNGGSFEPIGRVTGNGNSSVVIGYNFVDRDQIVLGDNTLCYQLKQVDFDGAFDMSSVICLDKSLSHKNIAIGPNPIEDKLQIDLDPWNDHVLEIEIIDVQGKFVHVQRQVTSHRNSIDMKNVKSGVYYIRLIENGETLHTQKVIKL